MSSSDTNIVGLNPSLDSEIGKFVVDTGLVTQDEVNYCREQQKQSSDPNQRSIADLLVENNFMTVNQAKRIKRSLEDRKNNQIPGFHLIKLLGKGAMAKVYMAKQLSLDRTVAIKVLPKTRSNDVDFVERFYKEGKAAARLAHPNIVQAIDVGANPEGIHYFVMEYVEGPTLYDMMQPPPSGQGKQFTEVEALDIAIQMADALVHAHQRGLVHRDVKPKNILLTPQGIAKLTDLGLARDMGDKQAAETEAGKAYGTPYYISPEQIRGEVDIDFRADLYSLGATLYHLVTGRPPFDGETPSAVMHRHLKDELIPPDHLNPDLSAGISEVIELAMAKNRDDRYASTADMLEDLKAVREGAPPVHARHQVNLDTVAKLDTTARTVDIEPAKPASSVWESPAVISVLTVAGISVVLNLIFGLIWLAS